MKIEMTKDDMENLEIMCRSFMSDHMVTQEMRYLYARVKDIASWPEETYDRNEKEQSRVAHAGSQVLYPIPTQVPDRF